MYVSAKLGWNIRDKQFKEFPEDLWDVYFMFLRRFEGVQYELSKGLSELVAMIANPKAFGEYIKRKKADVSEAPIVLDTLEGAVKGFRDEKGQEISLSAIEEALNKVNR